MSTDQITKPVDLSPEAQADLGTKIREWSGWGDAVLVFGTPGGGSPFASCNHVNRTFTVNPEPLVLNPHRVLHTITPFRLRQEAVLTGAMLHEVGHARHSHWQPGRYGNPDVLSHGAAHVDEHGQPKPVSQQCLALARLMEEPRVEGLMARDAEGADNNTPVAFGLSWTMRASAAHLLPTTQLTVTDPGQMIMDLITSWALRAGRQVSLASHLPKYRLPNWVGDFTSLLHETLVAEFEQREQREQDTDTDAEPDFEWDPDAAGPRDKAIKVVRWLTMMACANTTADTGTFMVDVAQDVLEILFPETDGDSDDAPMPGDPQHAPAEEAEEDDESESGDEESEEDQSGAGDEESEEDQSESGAGEGEPESEDDESEGDQPGDGAEDDETGDESDEQGSGEGEGQSDSDEPGEGEQESDQSGQTSALAEALAALEQEADDKTEAEGKGESDSTPPVTPGGGAGAGDAGEHVGQWRTPTKDEREVGKRAEKFLRDLLSPSESSRVVLTESPSATVDGAALAAWKAGGQVRDPHFFRRVKRTVQPSPPVKMAVLVDVSMSMSELQKPSALLSWALSNAALDLRNFAGRGVQVESTLIHWGSRAEVIQANGAVLPGLREFSCNQFTSAMGSALALVEEQMPGFFDPADKPSNRLIVQFTDWELGGGETRVTDYLSRALASGVNMLSVVPSTYSVRKSDHDGIISKCPVQRGRVGVVKYNKMFPDHVWTEAARMLA